MSRRRSVLVAVWAITCVAGLATTVFLNDGSDPVDEEPVVISTVHMIDEFGNLVPNDSDSGLFYRP